MSYQNVKVVNLVVGQDLNGDLYEALTIDSDGRVVKTAAETDVIVGVLAEDPGRVTVDGVDAVPVMLLDGVIMIKAGGAVAAGGIVVSNGPLNEGTVVTVADLAALGVVGQMGIGIALKSATAGQIFPMLAMTIGA